MGERSAIEWTDATWNPIVGCSILSPGCTNCYAMSMAARLQKINRTGGSGTAYVNHYDGTTKVVNDRPVWTGKVVLAPDHILTQPLRWKKPRTIFVNSMGDLFHEDAPDEWIDRIFAVMALCPQHIFQVLTKRSARMQEYISGKRFSVPILGAKPLERVHLEAAAHMEGDGGFWDVLKETGNIYSLYCSVPWPLPNVWLGVSAEDQPRADERVPDLLETPAATRFVSAEPLLGPIDFTKFAKLDWIIVGGESGPKARPMHPYWARSIRDQCAAAGVPFFFKQWGEWRHAPELAHLKDFMPEPWQRVPSGVDGVRYAFVVREGKRRAGRLLDGIEHNAIPEAQR